MTYSLTGLTTMGSIVTEEQSKDAQLFQLPLPRTDSTGAILLDLFGVLRTINISGVFVDGDGGLTVAQFIAELDALVSGTQTAKTFISDVRGSLTVLVQTESWTYEAGSPNKIDYRLTLNEGTVS